MAILIWMMVSLALWHFTVLVPDRFWGGIIGALLAAVVGGHATGFLLPTPGIPSAHPPGVGEALWAIPGSVLALVASYAYGARLERATPDPDRRDRQGSRPGLQPRPHGGRGTEA
jgi:hypothetical protein